MSSARDLKVSVISGDRRVPVGYAGNTIPVRSELFDGAIFFAHRPPSGSSAPWAFRERMEGRGSPDWLWEVQLHGRFLKQPRGPVWLRAELRDGPMQLGLVSRALCRAILKFARMMAQRRGGEIGYSFGDEAGEHPAISVPILLLDRIFVSDKTHALPVGGDEPKGTWRMVNGLWQPIERSSVTIDTQSYITVVLATSYIDWANWQLAGIPGLGSLSLETFWGDQGAWISLIDMEPDGTDRRFFLEANLEPSKVSLDTPRASSVCEDDYARVEEEVAADDDDEQQVGRGSSDEDFDEEQWIRQRTPYDDDDDVSPPVPEERVSLIPSLVLRPDASEGSSKPAAEMERVTQIEMDLDAPDASRLRSRAATDCLSDDESMEKAEDEEGNPATRKSQYSSPARAPASPGRRSRTPLSLPWYLKTSGGQLWWCISVEGRFCWRRDHQLSKLCEAVQPGFARLLRSGGSVQDMEMSRRRATQLLAQLDPSLVDEFTRIEVSLTSLLGSPAAGWMGVVEAEGRIVEHKVLVGEVSTTDVLHVAAEAVGRSAEAVRAARAAAAQVVGSAGGYGVANKEPRANCSTVKEPEKQRENEATPMALRWRSDTSARSWVERPGVYFADETTVELSGATVSRLHIVDAPAIAVTTAQRHFVFIVRQEADAEQWIASLRTSGSPSQASTPWRDRLRRWPVSRLVCNDSELCLETAKDPLGVSAQLLQMAVSAQGASQDSELVRQLNSLSCVLKGLDLSDLDPQDLWGFWVNAYHTLLIHACIQFGTPKHVRQLLGFYNNCSYVISGHIFSLAEIEHCVLRCHMPRASARLLQLLVRVWKRSDQELEERPSLRAPACLPAAFRARPDWRLNLCLSAGNTASSSRLPVFQRMPEAEFDALIMRAMERTLRDAGKMNARPLQLPYVLYRFRADAPGPSSDSHERRWAAVLAPFLGKDFDGRIAYRTAYKWMMRDRLDLL
eukprot:TRINITY_DN38269_c0_g1_i1.p1 TRINITY_DN38269_c0_g1~~TRINITY_DN38269_c0_g1_i1.p1  ORF type:complete len:962 (-),score=150.96 TRINITY_DN38269_c0_g1_i1:19-2904(-)